MQLLSWRVPESDKTWARHQEWRPGILRMVSRETVSDSDVRSSSSKAITVGVRLFPYLTSMWYLLIMTS